MTAPFLSLAAFSSEIADLVERASQFVVSVDARHRRPGTGIVLGADLVVTAEHVLERDEDITVAVSERRHAATVAGRDAATDIAVLRVPGLGGVAPPRSDALRTGQLVVSIARTASGGISAGAGLITAIGGPLRTGRGVVLRQVFRTDAAARPGTSGGAIVDVHGSVIAMTTSAMLRGLPVGIPAAQLWEIASALAGGKPLQRPYLGVSVQPVRFARPVEERARGLLVFAVAADSAADRAGLLVGDVLVAFNETPLHDVDDLQDRLAANDAGAPAKLEVVRGGTPLRVDITLGARPSA